MAEQIEQDEINAVLWKACDTFRGAVDAAEYKSYILVMLFLKYISDVWQEHYEDLKGRYGNDEDRIRGRLKRERFVLPEGCNFKSLYDQRENINKTGHTGRASNENIGSLGELINVALEQIEEENIKKLQGVFRNIDFNSEANLGQTKERNTRLKNLLKDFNDPKLDLRPSRVGKLDVIGNAYEYLIGKFAAGAGKKAGEFFTPPEVSRLIARLVDPQPGDRICDPACGSGSLLIKCGQQVGSKDFSLWGQENMGATWALCKMNMFLHSMDAAHIEWGDTIRNPKLLEGGMTQKFEVVVANPPFSLDKWGADDVGDDTYNRFHRGIPPKSKGDFAFITHMVETMTADSGRVGVVVPHGVLFRGGAEGKIRQKLIENDNLLDAVIGLPPNLFFGTPIPAAILIFKRKRSDKGILFIDASREHEQWKKQNRLRDVDIDKIVATYRARKTVEKYSYYATYRKVSEEHEFDLNISLYVDTFEEESPTPFAELNKEIHQVNLELEETSSLMKKYLKELNLA